jgi:multiple sugar transport system permease protein
MTERPVNRVIIYILLTIITALSLFPIYWMIITSLKINVDIFSLKPKFLFNVTGEHYHYIFTVADFPKFFINSFLIGILTTVFSLLISFPCAYGLSRLAFKSKEAVSLLILAGRMLPPVALVIPIYLLIQLLGMFNSIRGIILIHTTLTLPFSIWMLRSYFMAIPVELEEAAFIDGAGRFRILYKVIAPLSLPGIFATSIFAFVQSWNEYIFALTLSSSPAAQTLPVGAAGFITARGVAWGELSAAGTLMLVPVIIFSIFMQKYLKAGLFTGAVK